MFIIWSWVRIFVQSSLECLPSYQSDCVVWICPISIYRKFNRTLVVDWSNISRRIFHVIQTLFFLKRRVPSNVIVLNFSLIRFDWSRNRRLVTMLQHVSRPVISLIVKQFDNISEKTIAHSSMKIDRIRSIMKQSVVKMVWVNIFRRLKCFLIHWIFERSLFFSIKNKLECRSKAEKEFYLKCFLDLLRRSTIARRTFFHMTTASTPTSKNIQEYDDTVLLSTPNLFPSCKIRSMNKKVNHPILVKVNFFLGSCFSLVSVFFFSRLSF